MSQSVTCDHCHTVLVLDSRGDDENGEVSAWLKVGTYDGALTQDACTRACALALLDEGSDLCVEIDERHEVVAEIARSIREDRDGRSDVGGDGA